MQTRMNLKIPKNTRVLITSDIHGNLELFEKVLKEMEFTNDDILIINGDVAEKGTQSIALFKYIIELSKTHQVYMTLGNCDHLINHFRDPSKIEGMSNYMNWRTYTVLRELAVEMGYMGTYEERVAYAFEYHQDIIDYVEALPLIIETDAFICVHAGMRCDLEADLRFNTSEPNFYQSFCHFQKPVIVGHYPVCNYSDAEINHNIRFDYKRNIISIDGANNMKPLGQLNVLEYYNGDYKAHAFDHLEYVLASHDQKEHLGTHIHWGFNEIEILEKGKEFSLVYHSYSKEKIWVYNGFIDFEKEEMLEDTTDSLLEVKKHDPIHIAFETNDYYYIKCRGYVGWYKKTLDV